MHLKQRQAEMPLRPIWLTFPVLIYFLLDANFLFLWEAPGIIGEWVAGDSGMPFFVVAVIAVMAAVLSPSQKCLSKSDAFPWLYIAIFCVFLLIETVYTYSVSPSSLNYAIGLATQLACIIMAIPIYALLCMQRGYKRFFRYLSVLSLIELVVLAVGAYAYNQAGIVLFPLIPYNGTRGYGVRYWINGGFIELLILYGFVMALYSRNVLRKAFYACLAGLGLYVIMFVTQTRADVAYMLVCFAAAILFYKPKSKYGTLGKLLFITVVVLIILGGTLGNYYSAFSSSDYDYSTTARQSAIHSFITAFLQSPVFGIGFIPGSNDFRMHFVSDVGFIGQCGEWGILFASLYFALIVRIAYITIADWRIKSSEVKALEIALLLYLLLTSATLICFDASRASRIPLILALYEYLHHDQKGVHNTEISCRSLEAKDE